MKNNFKRCLALLLALMTIVGAFAIPVSAAEECDHDWKTYSTKEATCTAQGYVTLFCSKCQEYKVDIESIVPKLEHDYVEATKAAAANCTNHGWEVGAMICAREGCGNVKDLNEDGKLDADDKYIPVDSTKHNYVKSGPFGNPCEDKELTYKYVCSYNSKHKYEEKVPSDTDGKHDWVYEIISEATCKVEGKTKRNCKVCGAEDYIAIAKVAAHALSAVKYEKDEDGHYAYKQCGVCGDKFYEKGGAVVENKAAALDAHKDNLKKANYTVSTCAVVGKDQYECSVCKYLSYVNRNDQPDHTYNVNEPVAVVESSHTVAKVVHGYSEYYCTTCKKNFKIYEGLGMREVPENLNDHAWYVVPGTVVPGTCYVVGIQTEKCSVANCTAQRNVETEKLHAYGAEQIKRANCIEPGYKYQECAYCGDVKKIADIPTTNENGKHGALEEDITNAEYKPATCLNKGRIPMVCEDCGVILDWKDEKWTGAAHTVTKTSEGDGCYYTKYDVYTCTVCNDTRYDKVADAAGSHDNGEYITLREASCFEEGIIGSVCARCGLKTEVTRIAIDPDAHTGKQVYSINAATEWGVNNPNTEDKNGAWPVIDPTKYDCLDTVKEWWYCNACHRNYRAPMKSVNLVEPEEDAGIILLPDFTVVELDATTGKAEIVGYSGDHAYYIDVINPTSCYKVGTGIIKCAYCDKVERNVTIDKVPHVIGRTDGTTADEDAKYTTTDPATLIGDATCEKSVKYRVFCIECDDWVGEGVQEALPHEYADDGWGQHAKVNGKNTGDKLATCKDKGQESNVCVNCGKFYETRVIPVNNQAHKIDTGSNKTTAGVAPTCLKSGKVTTYTCSTCKKLFVLTNADGEYLIDDVFTAMSAAPAGTLQQQVSSAPVVEALGHQDLEDAVGADRYLGLPIGATCTVMGYTPIVCKVCAEPLADDPATTIDESDYYDGVEIGWLDHTDALDHEKVDSANNKGSNVKEDKRFKQDATCTTYAYSYFKCTRCDVHLDKKQTGTTKKAHVNAAGDVLTGSCLIDDLADFKCKNCKNEIPAEHDFSETTEKFDVCKVTRYTCKVCGFQKWDPADDGTGNVKHTYVPGVAPTLTEEGTEVCLICAYENPVKVAKLDAVTFSMNAYNPNGGDIVNGGLVYVDVMMKTVEAIDVNNIRVAINFKDTHLVFSGIVGNESVFGNVSSEPVANDQAGVVYVFDDAGKERSNITLDGEMKFVTLAFYVKPNVGVNNDGVVKDRVPSELEFTAVVPATYAPSVSYYDSIKGAYSDYSFDITTNAKIDLAINQLGDIDNNGKVNNYDLVAVRDAMTDGAEYDAVLDIDHDGEITIKDYKLIKEFMVYKYDYWQFADIDSFNSFVEYANKKEKEITVTNYITWLETEKA